MAILVIEYLFKEGLIAILHKFFQKLEEGTLLSSFFFFFFFLRPVLPRYQNQTFWFLGKL